MSVLTGIQLLESFDTESFLDNLHGAIGSGGGGLIEASDLHPDLKLLLSQGWQARNIGTGNDIKTDYQLTVTPTSSSAILITVDGVTQEQSVDYSVSGSLVQFNEPPGTGEKVISYYLAL